MNTRSANGNSHSPALVPLGRDPWIVGAILLGTLVRAWSFGQVPAGLHQDEASAAYDAFCLWNYGIDRNGFHNPVVLVGWGSGMFALLSYAALPVIAMAGLTSWVIRLPCLLAGIIAMLAFALLAERLHGRRVARTATFLLAICPWSVMISRWGLDSNMLPAVFLCGVTALTWAFDRPWFLPFAAGLFGLSLYAYGTAYIALPVFLTLVIAYGVYHRRWPAAPAIVGLSTLALVALPAVLYVAVNWWKIDSIITPWFSIPRLPGVPRFDTVGNFHITDPLFIVRVGENLVGAARLLITQSDGQVWNEMPWFGIFYLFSLPLAVVGIYQLGRECWTREFRPAFMLLAWYAAALVVAALVRPNINRLNLAWLPLVYAVALGLTGLTAQRPTWFRGAIWAYTVSFAAFVGAYFTNYSAYSSNGFNPGLIAAIRAASKNQDRIVYVTHSVTFPYIFVLYANEIDPREFQRTVEYFNPHDEFRLVTQFGRFRFVHPPVEEPGPKAFVFRHDELPEWTAGQQRESFGDFVVVSTD